jgi:hypothetical protein
MASAAVGRREGLQIRSAKAGWETGEDDQVGKIEGALFLAKSSSKRGVTHQFLYAQVWIWLPLLER